jgi:hypothetical protein
MAKGNINKARFRLGAALVAPLSTGLRKALMRERAGIKRYSKELEAMLAFDEYNKWAKGQIAYGKRRVFEIDMALFRSSELARGLRKAKEELNCLYGKFGQ